MDVTLCHWVCSPQHFKESRCISTGSSTPRTILQNVHKMYYIGVDDDGTEGKHGW